MKTTLLFISILISTISFSQRQKGNEQKLPIFATERNFQNLLKDKNLNFVYFGFANTINSKKFKEKYGVDIKMEGCVITPKISKLAKENNLVIANYLNKKFGNVWKKDLNAIPFGLD